MRKMLGIIVIAIIGFSSCQREIDPAELPNTPPPDPVDSSDSLYPTHIIEIDNTTAVADTFAYDSLEYDSNKRLTRWIVANYPFDPTHTYEVRLFYQGADTMPYQETFTYFILNPDGTRPSGDSGVCFRFYDSQNRPLKDSTVKYDFSGAPSNFNYWFTRVATYEYSGTQIYSHTYDTNGGISSDTALLDGQGNQVQKSGNGNYLIQSTFGSQVNPMYRFRNKLNQLRETQLDVFNLNVAQSHHYTDFNDPDQNENYTITNNFDSNGKLIKQDWLDPAFDHTTYVFYYRVL